MSISVFVLAGAWLLKGELKTGLDTFLKNKTALILASVFLMHIIGLLWTSNFNFAFNDLRIKLPLLLLPFLFAASASLSENRFKLVLEIFAAAVFLSVLCSFSVYLGLFKKEIKDIRDISLFISHIRLSLMICLSVVIHFYYWKDSDLKFKLYRILAILAGLYFLFLTGSVTGILILFILSLLPILKKLNQKKRNMTIAGLGIIIASASIYVYASLGSFFNPSQEDLANLETHTIQGNPYEHDLENDDRENGKRVYLYISWKELENEWSNRSELDFNGQDRKGQELKYTLVRYMTALGLRKDAEGFDKLQDKDIENIEKGITNPMYENFGLKARIYQVLWELEHYKRGNDPSGHSVSMRLEFWKNGFAVFKDHPVLGVGTGDVQDEINKKYEERNSPLHEKWRLRSHNQYLTFALTFGLVGLLWFLYTLYVPLKDNRDIIYLSFIVIVILSMLSEDTLESQAGVTFFAFFNSFLLLAKPGKKDL